METSIAKLYIEGSPEFALENHYDSESRVYKNVTLMGLPKLILNYFLIPNYFHILNYSQNCSCISMPNKFQIHFNFHPVTFISTQRDLIHLRLT